MDNDWHKTSYDPVEVHVVERNVYTFPKPEARCSAHGQTLCIQCARNPSTCANETGSDCQVYAENGMHWDTCPNRIR